MDPIQRRAELNGCCQLPVTRTDGDVCSLKLKTNQQKALKSLLNARWRMKWGLPSKRQFSFHSKCVCICIQMRVIVPSRWCGRVGLGLKPDSDKCFIYSPVCTLPYSKSASRILLFNYLLLSAPVFPFIWFAVQPFKLYSGGCSRNFIFWYLKFSTNIILKLTCGCSKSIFNEITNLIQRQLSKTCFNVIKVFKELIHYFFVSGKSLRT